MTENQAAVFLPGLSKDWVVWSINKFNNVNILYATHYSLSQCECVRFAVKIYVLRFQFGQFNCDQMSTVEF